jgi:cell pole-organizing protein PopZ
MAQTAKAQEPSMEEILASIRRIIADDEGKARAPEPPKPAAAAAPPRPAAPPPKPPEAVAPVREASPPPRPAVSQDEIDAMLSGMDAAAPQSNGDASDDGVADVLDLTESMAAPAPQPPVFRTVESQPDVFFSEAAEPPPPAPRMEEPRPLARAPAEGALMSSSTSAAVDAAFNTLAHTVLTQNARTLEDLVTEMMRPMLKAWLDDNLPGLVERVVRAEIERVSRGRS